MTRKWTTEIFVEEAKKVHGEKYDYTKVEYNRLRDSVTIICPIHGEFRQRAESHLNGCRCLKCAAIKHGIDSRGNTDKWIQKARKVHGDFYDYSKVEYKTSNSRVIITCPVHGEFTQRAANHLHGRGCRKCNLKEAGLKRRKPKVPEPSRPSKTEVWIEKAKKVHGEHFDYSKVFYDNAHGKVCIICKNHGKFWQKASDHLTRKPTQGCPKCVNKVKYTKEIWLNKCKEKYKDQYNYDESEFKGRNKKVKIYCNIHNVYFYQFPIRHLKKLPSCPICKKERTYQCRPDYNKWFKKVYEIFGDKYDYTKAKDTFSGTHAPVTITCRIHGDFVCKRAYDVSSGHGCKYCSGSLLHTIDLKKYLFEKFGDIYDYSLVDYVDLGTPIKIICKEHGLFTQKYYALYHGCGCSKCSKYKSKGEIQIENILKESNIKYEIQKSFEGCIYKQLLKFDFYLPDYDIAIEYDGKQHYESVEWFGGEKGLVETKKRDRIKTSYCERHNIHLKRIRYDECIETTMKEIINA